MINAIVFHYYFFLHMMEIIYLIIYCYYYLQVFYAIMKKIHNGGQHKKHLVCLVSFS